MTDFLYMLLAAGKKNVEGNWIELLIPVLVIIVYAIGGIVKMRSNLKEQQEKETRAPKPRYKPLGGEVPGGAMGRHVVDEMSERERAVADRRMERQLEGAARRPAVRRPATLTRPEERRTLEAFLDTAAPKSLAERAAEAQAQARARAKAQAQNMWPRSAQRREAEMKRKPKVTPAAPSPTIARAEEAAEKVISESSLAEKLNDHDQLRDAIVLCEILGKPLALRDM